jgi:2-C-methyl-D-erythritol 2,4-cyclodiphosphate synthase
MMRAFAHAPVITRERGMYRVGIGWDVHPLVRGRKLYLGGIHFPDEPKGLDGHSDADVVCHAVCDALLGALALGDIGEHFPNTDATYKNAPGSELLRAVRGKVAGKKYRVVNIDCTVMSDAVRLGEKKAAMAETIASHLGIDAAQVSVKATSWEGHGAVGRGEVVACQAIAMVAEGM